MATNIEREGLVMFAKALAHCHPEKFELVNADEEMHCGDLIINICNGLAKNYYHSIFASLEHAYLLKTMTP